MTLASHHAQRMRIWNHGYLTMTLKQCFGKSEATGHESWHFLNPRICLPLCCHQRQFVTNPPGRTLQHNYSNQWHPMKQWKKTLVSGFLLSESPSSQSFRTKSSSSPHVITRLTEDIDIEKMREDVRKDRLMGRKVEGSPILSRIKQTVAERCDEAIKNLNQEEEKKLKVIQLEHNFLYSNGYAIMSPENMTSEHWLEAMTHQSKAQRLKYYLYIEKKKHMKISDLKKRQEKKEQMLTRVRMDDYEHGRIFMRIYDATMKRWLDYRLAGAMVFGTPLVLDMDYVDHMRPQELKNTGKQLQSVYCENRADEQLPFHLHFTGCPDENPIFRTMQMALQGNQHFLATVTEKSYLDLFDKDRLVYLSPNGRQVMKEFDHSAVYIVGIFNDKATQKPISYARAKQQGIKCQRLPLDEYLEWSMGSKALTLDQMQKILLAVKNGKSWPEAFKAIPKRKIRNSSGMD